MQLADYNLNASDGTTPTAQPGTYLDIKGTRYRYSKAAGSIAAYAACSGATPIAMVEATTTTVNAIGTAGGYFCCPQFAVASGEYFWGWCGPGYLREDDVTFIYVLSAALNAAGALLNTTATPGVIDDSATTALAGAALITTVGGAQAAAQVVAYRQCSWVR